MDAPVLTDHQSKKIDRAMEGACLLLGQYFKTRVSLHSEQLLECVPLMFTFVLQAYDRRRQCYDDTFLEVFEDEYIQEKVVFGRVPSFPVFIPVGIPRCRSSL